MCDLFEIGRSKEQWHYGITPLEIVKTWNLGILGPRILESNQLIPFIYTMCDAFLESVRSKECYDTRELALCNLGI